MKSHQLHFIPRALWLLSWGGVVAGLGCSDTKYENLKVFLQAHEQDVITTDYRIQPPDVIMLSSPTSKEVDGHIQRVRGDGKISLKLLGEVKISGLTCAETGAKVADLLARYYTDPTVSVRVMSSDSQKIYVFGEVSAPGAYAFTGRDSLIDVLSRARMTWLAWRAQVKVIRPSANPDERHELVLDVDKLITKGDMRTNFLLQAGDIVYIPPTPLAWTGQRVRELLFPFQPALGAYTMGASIPAANDVYFGDDNKSSNNNDSLKRDLMLMMIR